MNSKETEIYCPLVAREIEKIICEDVSLSAEDMQPERFAPKEFQNILSWKEICLTCPKHTE